MPFPAVLSEMRNGTEIKTIGLGFPTFSSIIYSDAFLKNVEVRLKIKCISNKIYFIFIINIE